MYAISSFRWAMSCPLLNSIGGFCLLMCLSRWWNYVRFWNFCALFFMCTQFVLVHYCFYVCNVTPICHCFCACRFQKLGSTNFNAWWSSMHAISSFKWAIPCPWPSFVGVFYVLMCSSWSWLVCEVLAVLHFLFSSMIKILMFCVCTVLLLFDVILCV
jgi:hypothetical protein